MANRTKILVLNSCVNGGGAGRSLETLLAVRDPRIEPIVVMPAPGMLAQRITGVAELVFIPEFVERMRRSPYSWPDRMHMPWLHPLASIFSLLVCISKLTRLAKAIRPDVIYCNHMLAKPVGVAVGARTGIPVVFHSRACHQLWADGKFYDWLGRRKIVKRIICNSEASATVYRRNSDAKVIIIPNGIDLDHYNRQATQASLRLEFQIPAETFIVGFAGRIQASKGIDWLLRSFAAVALNNSQVKLVIVGGNDSSLQHDALAGYRLKAVAMGLAESVIFTGYRDDIRPYLMDFDVLVMPSILPESFGRVLLEAMALEVPVVVSAHGGAVEVVRDEKDGLWVAVEDTDGLAGAIEKLYSDPALRRLMGQNGRHRVQSCYARSTTAKQVYDVLVDCGKHANDTHKQPLKASA